MNQVVCTVWFILYVVFDSQIAEKHLQLCRDDSIAGIRFYKNIFLETELS